MADTPKTTSQLQTIFANNTTGDISAQDMRDFVVSSWNKLDDPDLLNGLPANVPLLDALDNNFAGNLSAGGLSGPGTLITGLNPSELGVGTGNIRLCPTTDGLIEIQNDEAKIATIVPIAGGTLSIKDAGDVERIKINTSGSLQLFSESSNVSASIDESGYNIDSNSVNRFQISSSSTNFRNFAGTGNAIDVNGDSTVTNIAITSSDAVTESTAGTISLIGGSSDIEGRAAGNINITSGGSTSTGSTGTIVLTGGSTDNAALFGGEIQITGGANTATGVTTGLGGDVVIKGGSSTEGDGGNVILKGSVGGNGPGRILLKDQNDTLLFSAQQNYLTIDVSVECVSAFTRYNDTALASIGLPHILAASVNNNVTAAVSSSSLITLANSGLHRVSVTATIDTAATNTSTLGDITCNYTDGNSSAAKVMKLASAITDNANNAVITGTAFIFAESGSDITISIDYSTSGATDMSYSWCAVVERL